MTLRPDGEFSQRVVEHRDGSTHIEEGRWRVEGGDTVVLGPALVDYGVMFWQSDSMIWFMGAGPHGNLLMYGGAATPDRDMEIGRSVQAGN